MNRHYSLTPATLGRLALPFLLPGLSTLASAVPAVALHTFTVDSGSSRCFFRNSTTVTPPTAPIPVTLADPSYGLVVAHGSTVLPCPAAPSGSLTCLHLPSFATKLGVELFQNFSPIPKMTTLWVRLHLVDQHDYKLHSLDLNTAFLQGSLHEEIWLRCPSCFTWSFPAGSHWSLRRPVYGLRLAPPEWHDTLRTTLAALGFAPSTADPSLFLRTDTCRSYRRDTPALTWVLQRFGFRYSLPQSTPLPTGHSLSAPPSDESVEPSGPYPELVGCLVTSGMSLVLGGWGLLVLTGHADVSWVDDLATQRSSQGYTFSLGSGSVSWGSTRSSSVLSSSCEAEIYAGAMAAQELRWLTYVLTDLGERPRSPPVLYVDNKAMIALCQEHRLEHMTKHIALRYFLDRELQQRGQLCLAYVATRANTANIFTKALQPRDQQRFCTVLGLVPTLPHLLTA
ncbi:unnamed protein product [Closterium sp. NIES-53]